MRKEVSVYFIFGQTAAGLTFPWTVFRSFEPPSADALITDYGATFCRHIWLYYHPCNNKQKLVVWVQRMWQHGARPFHDPTVSTTGGRKRGKVGEWWQSVSLLGPPGYGGSYGLVLWTCHLGTVAYVYMGLWVCASSYQFIGMVTSSNSWLPISRPFPD